MQPVITKSLPITPSPEAIAGGLALQPPNQTPGWDKTLPSAKEGPQA